jgi:hypothetical protein
MKFIIVFDKPHSECGLRVSAFLGNRTWRAVSGVRFVRLNSLG